MNQEPLARRMRPTHIDEIAGQKHIIGPNTALYKLILSGNVPSMLFYGEPGIGKTSIASAIAGTVDRPFYSLNATTAGKKDVEQVIEIARKIKKERVEAINGITDETTEEEKKKIYAMPSNVILFIDEIHRFNKLQQDTLLDAAEERIFVFIAATTSNPYHDVSAAIRSRTGVIKQLSRLTKEDVIDVLKRAVSNKEKGLGEMNVTVTDEQLLWIAEGVNGEVRSALNVLEMAAFAGITEDGSSSVITDEILEEFLEHKGFNHDKDGDGHYNVLSAFQKSIRGSDVDAALHYLGRLIVAGDEKSIVRRLKIIAYEDIANANIQAVIYTCMACDAVREVGFPEAIMPLSAAVVALCLSPKSDTAHKALSKAIGDIQNGFIGEIPMHLRDTHYKSAVKLGHVGYQYPHDDPRGWVKQQYLPDLLKDRKYYEPKDKGDEAQFAATYRKLENLKSRPE